MKGPEATVTDAGWLALRDLVDPDRAGELATECESVLSALGTQVGTGDKQYSGTHRLVDLEVRVPAVTEIAAHPRLLTAVRSLLGDEPVLAGGNFRCPQPGFGGQKLHADDLPMLSPGPTRVVIAIIALTDFTSTNGATRVVPGSHQRPDLQRRSGNLEHHPGEILLEGKAGTAFVFSGHLLHSGTTNRSNHARPALQLTFLPVGSADTTGPQG